MTTSNKHDDPDALDYGQHGSDNASNRFMHPADVLPEALAGNAKIECCRVQPVALNRWLALDIDTLLVALSRRVCASINMHRHGTRRQPFETEYGYPSTMTIRGCSDGPIGSSFPFYRWYPFRRVNRGLVPSL